MTKGEKISCHFQAKWGFFIQKINKQNSWFFRFWSLWPINKKQNEPDKSFVLQTRIYKTLNSVVIFNWFCHCQTSFYRQNHCGKNWRHYSHGLELIEEISEGVHMNNIMERSKMLSNSFQYWTKNKNVVENCQKHQYAIEDAEKEKATLGISKDWRHFIHGLGVDRGKRRCIHE